MWRAASLPDNRGNCNSSLSARPNDPFPAASLLPTGACVSGTLGPEPSAAPTMTRRANYRPLMHCPGHRGRKKRATRPGQPFLVRGHRLGDRLRGLGGDRLVAPSCKRAHGVVGLQRCCPAPLAAPGTSRRPQSSKNLIRNSHFKMSPFRLNKPTPAGRPRVSAGTAGVASNEPGRCPWT